MSLDTRLALFLLTRSYRDVEDLPRAGLDVKRDLAAVFSKFSALFARKLAGTSATGFVVGCRLSFALGRPFEDVLRKVVSNAAVSGDRSLRAVGTS
jgi:hypothetical protein